MSRIVAPNPLAEHRTRGRPPLSSDALSLRRDRILEAATKMFVERGFSSVTLSEVGAAAGVTKKTIYELVGDKDALFRAVCNSMRAEGPSFRFEITTEDSDPSDVLHKMARQLIEHSLDKRLTTLERAVMAEATRREAAVSEVITESRDNLFRVIARLFDLFVEQGVFPPLDTITAARMFYDATVGTRGFRAALGAPVEPADDDEIAMRVRMFLKGYIEQIA